MDNPWKQQASLLPALNANALFTRLLWHWVLSLEAQTRFCGKEWLLLLMSELEISQVCVPCWKSKSFWVISKLTWPADCVHRVGPDLLEKELPKRTEFAIFFRLSKVQEQLYKKYLEVGYHHITCGECYHVDIVRRMDGLYYIPDCLSP